MTSYGPGVDRSCALGLIGAACALHSLGLSVANSGNVSMRYDQGFLITPSAVLYEQLAPQDIVYVSLEGNSRRDKQEPLILAGKCEPSSEWRIHRDIYRVRAEAGAIVHAHSRYCTALSCLRQQIPAFHYMVAKAGGDSIRCARYATFGTQALSDAVVAALDERKACLMANHGMLALGADLQAALLLAQETESLAAQYCTALSFGAALGVKPVLIAADEMARVVGKFAGYGQLTNGQQTNGRQTEEK